MIGMPGLRLSDEQQAVVDHPLERPGVVDAGAGTGKTFTIVERVAALVASRTVRPDQILLLTFGRKAAAELRARLAQRLGESALECQTFHAFAWSILASHVYDGGLSPETTVIEDADARVEFRAAFESYLADPSAPPVGFPLRPFNRGELRTELFKLRQDLKQQGVSVEAFRERALAAADRFASIGYRVLLEPYAKRYKGKDFKEIAPVSDEEFASQIREEKMRVDAVAAIFDRFDRSLAQRHALTYADILMRAEAALRESPLLRDELRARYRCCIVDEYQDTDLAQHRFLEALFGAGLERVMVVGDVLQSIYSFRGAHPANVEIFKQAPGALTYPLLDNRRSLQEILDLAHHAVLPAHADARPLAGRRGEAGEQIVHVSSVWDDARAEGAGDRQPRGYIPFDEARVLEAKAVAARISHLLECGGDVETGAGKERLSPRHIAILSRTKTNVQPVTDALLEAGIPFRLVGGVGFYDAPEIRDALAWLRLLADPFDAAAVARALASTTIGAPDALVANLARREERDETSFARRVLVDELPTGDDESRAAAAAALALRGLLDDLAPYAALPLLGALRAVYERTGIEHHYRTSVNPRAPQACANLEKLEALARAYAQDNPGSQPADFVHFIGELERIDFDEREADVSSHDAVTISTIHSAKGLEWPIVFVLSVWPDPRGGARLRVDDDGALLYAEGADGSRPFHYLAVVNQADQQGHVLRKDERDGRADDDEERRLFYVAITRARDRLFLSGPRYRPSKDNAAGKPHRFLERVYEWFARRAWHADQPLPATPGLPVLEPSRPREAPAPKLSPAGSIASGEASLALALSYSLVAKFEQCPRRATYRAIMRVPEVGGVQRRQHARRGWVEPEPSELAGDDSLLGAQDYGAVLHKALELWALAKRDGAPVPSASAAIADAGQILELVLGRSQAQTAQRALARIASELATWSPLHVEAPFTLDFGTQGRPLLVSGYLDLLARDGNGHVCLLDYKTGGARGERFGLQLALYKTAAREVYGYDDVLCFVGRVQDDAFALEPVEPVADEELRRRIVQVRDRLLARDTHPLAGAWCATCGYRGAPCQDYQRPKH